MSELIQINTPKKTAKRKLFIRTFGCQMNEYDSQKLYKLLEGNYEPTQQLEDADCVIVNTCSVREKPEQKLYSYLGELAELKQAKQDMLIGVGGCVAQQEGDAITKRSKAVDFVFGTHNLSLVPSLISRREEGFEPQVAVNYREDWEDLPFGFTGDSRVAVFVAISRGCNKNCSYCIVPTTRGVEVSRPLAEIEREIKIAAHRGAKEVMLLGQTVNSYGLDLEPRMKFSQLIEKIAEIQGIERIRFTSPHPQEVKDDFIDLVTRNPKVCRHIHMPLQSGSDKILKAMNRNYRRARYLKIIASLKERVPDIGITTDIIVGFPGETEADFQETLSLMREVQFDNSYSFMFSPRPGTEAAKMEDDVPESEKLRRLQELQKLQTEITNARLQSWIGKTVEVLVEGPQKYHPQRVQGRTSQNWTCNIMNDNPSVGAGDIVKVAVTAVSQFTIKGELILS